MGQHPFLMVQLYNNDFFGIYILNANAQQFKIDPPDAFGSRITFTSIGGIIDLMFFVGPTYQEVLQQYHKVIGKAPLLPICANGFHSRSSSYNTDDLINAAIKSYTDNKYPLESIALPLSSLNNMFTQNYTVSFKDLQIKYPQLKWIIPIVANANNKTENLDLIQQLKT